MPTAGIDNPSWASGMTRQPPSAQPFNLPFDPSALPEGTPGRASQAEKMLAREEQSRVNQRLQQEYEAKQAREAEIFRRESAQRERLRQAIFGGQPEATPTQPRVTSRTPAWEQPATTPNRTSTAPASPPPTPATSGAASMPDLSMEALPATATPRQAVGYADPRPGAPPSSLPEPAGMGGAAVAQAIAKNAAYGGIGAAAATFTYGVITGQPPLDAAGRALATGAGTAFGTALGSAFGPVGMFVGGAVGGAIGSALYDRLFHPPSAQPRRDDYHAGYPFTGGQDYNGQYRVWADLSWDGGQTWFINSTRNDPTVGRVLSLQVEVIGQSTPTKKRLAYILRIGQIDGSIRAITFAQFDEGEPVIQRINHIERTDGLPDNAGNPPPLPVPQTPQQHITINNYGNAGYAPPRAEPQSKPAPTAYAPGGLPVYKLPHARPIGEAHPDNSEPPMLLPGLKPAGSPEASGAPSNNTNSNPPSGSMTVDPNTGIVTIVSPGSSATSNPVINPWMKSLPPVPQDPTAPLPLVRFRDVNDPNHATTSGISTTTKPTPTPDAISPIPKAQPQPQTQQPVTQKDFKDFQDKFDEFTRNAAILAGLTPIIQQIANNTNTEAIKNAASAGTCSTLQPGGCMAPMAQNAQNAANNSAAANALLQGLDLSLLGVIDRKLGNQVDGGLSGLLTKTKDRINKVGEFLQIDRLLNILIWWQTLHNAFMLSNNIATTLTSALSQALAALPGNSLLGIPTEAEGGSPLDIGAQINGMFETTVKKAVGEDNYTSIKATWAKANRIYQASANLLGAVQSAIQGVQSVVEVTGEYTGKIGNALKSFGLVGEKAYNWMAEKMSVKTAWMQKLEDGLNSTSGMASNLESVVSSVASTQDSINQIATQKTDFDNALKDITKSDRTHNWVVKTQADADKTASQSPTVEPTDLNRPVDETV